MFAEYGFGAELGVNILLFFYLNSKVSIMSYFKDYNYSN